MGFCPQCGDIVTAEKCKRWGCYGRAVSTFRGGNLGSQRINASREAHGELILSFGTHFIENFLASIAAGAMSADGSAVDKWQSQ